MKIKLTLITMIACILSGTSAYSQISHTGLNRTGTDQVGYDGSAGTPGQLEIRNDFSTCAACSIDFYIDNNKFLQVLTGGDLNIVQPANGYKIDNDFVLRHNGILSSIYVGINAGNTAGAIENTFVGTNSGAASGTTGVDGTQNTFIGYYAGPITTEGYHNTFVGSHAGFSNIYGNSNTLIGYEAGRSCVGNYNTIVGREAGYWNTGSDNSFFGKAAGFNSTGTNNCYIGNHAGGQSLGANANTCVGTAAGYNDQGGKNTYIGNRAGVHMVGGQFNVFIGLASQNSTIYTTLNNSIAIGCSTVVTGSNQMILGDNAVSVGIGLSGNPTGPQNKLEIDEGNTDQSGLRFRQLTDISTPIQNSGPGLLSVDSDGDVVYVDQIGNYCGASIPSPLKNTFEVPLDRYNYYFSGQGIGNTDVIVGFSCTVYPLPYAKFQSWQMTTQGGGMSVAGNFYNSTNDLVAVGGLGLSASSLGRNIGLLGRTREYTGKNNIGVLGETVPAATLLAGNLNVGVYGYAKWAGGHTSTHFNYAVVGDLGTAVIVNTPTATDMAGYFNGDLLTTTAFWNLSDSTLKENIQSIVNPMDVINALDPKSYTFKQQGNESMILPVGTHYGLLAQEVESILPGAVRDCVHPERMDTLGNQTHAEIAYKAVNTNELIPFLIGAIKEQQQTMEAMQDEIAILSGGGNRQGNFGSDDEEVQTNGINVQLTNAKAIILNQNVPNPFAEQTTITYFLTDDVKKAQMFFYDNKGTILKTVEINEKGAGQINVFAADLSSGNYTYTLVADGKVIDSKKMIKTN